MATTKKRSSKSATAQTGAGGELHQTATAADARITTNHGVPIGDNQNSLKAGARGPSLLEDFVLREKIQHFDHERIPERIVHARGSAAHGTFELTHSLKKFSRAKILTEVGAKTDVFVRFSTVAGGAGSVDTPRDVRGFAVKFYTKEGNWDLVGNNIPVFFIQDAIKFPDLIHAVKMEADRGYPQAASAHDTFWDFIGLMPESTHMIMWAMSDRTIPRSLRMIEGFGVNTFRLLDDKDRATFVKFHWRPKLGTQSTCWDEAVKIAGADPDYHRRDLYEAIASGNFPEWDFGVQVLTQEQADKLPFDILDATKVIPEEMVPLKIIGRLVLNRNPDNFFAETEQSAFLPTNMPPGIDVSEDPLLQGRLFSYQDTQLSRLGTVNFHQIPINRAKGCPFQNMQRDGQMQTQVFTGRANYEPNSLAQAGEQAGPREDASAGFKTYALPLDGVKIRQRSESFADHFSHARLFYRSQTESEQAHIASALVFELSKVTLPHVRARVLANVRNVDEDLAARVASGMNVELPAASKPAVAPIDMKPSPMLRIVGKYPESLQGRAVGILVTDGADGAVVNAVRKAVEAEGGTVKIVAPKIGGVTLKNGKVLAADGQLAGTPSVLFDAVAIIVSEDGCAELVTEGAAVDFAKDAFGHLKAIGHSAEAQPLLEKAGVVADDGVVLLARDVEAFLTPARTRQWDREPSVRMLA
ncbi:catalase C [Variibacter gotjawalensis]|uniref:Catalase n=1 Tax=Variibacter gotjawalensis TaxID=1333996 RepID=A0A0S3PUI7_9BRAD|nr:catalase [Variibacter gotjawalensis]NIK49865.1 catalase [Variibacter gotjawalensis]RZS45864.1 catalase [Variibacter gotjawalensis]BAT59540.1 catalase C [Variibacter gotjawalensis]